MTAGWKAAAIGAWLALCAVPASAQEIAEPCQPISLKRVVVATHDGASAAGTLLCLTSEQVLLLQDGQTRALPLMEVKRIQTRPDPVWDGAVKGAVIPLVFWAIFCRECDAAPMAKTVGTYGLIGLAWDSLQPNTKTVYVGRPRASIAWRIRF